MLYNYRKRWEKKFKKYVNRLWMSVFVGVLTLVSLSLSTRLFLLYMGEGGEERRIKGAYHYADGSEEGADLPTWAESRGEPSRAEPKS